MKIPEPFEISFLSMWWVWKRKGSQCWFDHTLEDQCDLCQIIGNIHENIMHKPSMISMEHAKKLTTLHKSGPCKLYVGSLDNQNTKVHIW